MYGRQKDCQELILNQGTRQTIAWQTTKRLGLLSGQYKLQADRLSKLKYAVARRRKGEAETLGTQGTTWNCSAVEEEEEDTIQSKGMLNIHTRGSEK